MVGTNPTTKTKLAHGSGYMQRAHIMAQLDVLCPEMYLRQPWRLAQNMIDDCEDLVSEHTEEIVSTFKAVYPGGHGVMLPAREFCINAKFCQAKQFDAVLPDLQNFHVNMTSNKKTNLKQKATKIDL